MTSPNSLSHFPREIRRPGLAARYGYLHLPPGRHGCQAPSDGITWLQGE